ncbi:hypothetical protein FORMB_25210 [Formosa sp. Hel1_33_131]|uniref:hypothetical protein n=1 Tax=Formosa sp. Hel1_33_131 TaxID=1336794 RepID=UPI00084E1208|nr:hypothetical protein [Formosa sp. Hel1_33_131]AOR29538.1 hypothetical protein FORMB_25210 [Formosa sp. Hel1_33_131]
MKREGQELNEFTNLLDLKTKGNTKVQTHWAEVVEVDWNNKTMTVKGLIDDLEFYDVLLGLGSVYKKPKIGAKCLIGLILNNEAATFLIEAEAVDELFIEVGTSTFKIDANGFLVKRNNETLKKVLNDLIVELNKIIVIQGTSINVPAMNAIKQRLNTVLT